jgi:hypothetical protein
MYPLLVVLTVAYLLVASVTTFDIRLIQAKRTGAVPPDEPLLPSWVGLFHWVQWGLFLALLLLDWKYALAVFGIKFVLKLLPVLETIGNLLLAPLRWRGLVRRPVRPS